MAILYKNCSCRLYITHSMKIKKYFFCILLAQYKKTFYLCIAILRKASFKTANGSVVQLVRISPCHGEGRGFESRPVRN